MPLRAVGNLREGSGFDVLTLRPASTAGPRVVGILLIMLLVRSLPISHSERPFVRQCQHVLQQFYFGDDLLFVHSVRSDVSVAFKPLNSDGSNGSRM